MDCNPWKNLSFSDDKNLQNAPQLQKFYTPENKHGTWKYPFGKGETFTNHQFLGSMFVLGGVYPGKSV